MKKIKIALGLIICIFFFILVFIGNYFYDFAINSNTDKSVINSQEGEQNKDDDSYKQWFNSNKKEVSMKSVTALNLVGYEFINENSKKWIIVTHGYGTSAEHMVYYIKRFYDLGYNVFAPDLLGLGKSEGDFISMGGFDSDDMKNWIDKLNDSYGNIDIALFGISMGATTVMNCLDAGISQNVKLFIADSGFVDTREQFIYQLKKLYGLPQFPIIPMTSLITKIRAGYYIEDVEVIDALKSTNLPALIMHGSDDSFVPKENADIIYETLKSHKKLYISQGCKHVQGARKDADNYWGEIQDFLTEYF